MLCCVYRSPWADKREEEENTPNIYFDKQPTERHKRKQTTKRKKGGKGEYLPSQEKTDMTVQLDAEM